MANACMKRDGRKMAIERVREGERPSTVIASYGFHRCAIYIEICGFGSWDQSPATKVVGMEFKKSEAMQILEEYAPYSESGNELRKRMATENDL
jgi:hypothetical protein